MSVIWQGPPQQTGMDVKMSAIGTALYHLIKQIYLAGLGFTHAWAYLLVAAVCFGAAMACLPDEK